MSSRLPRGRRFVLYKKAAQGERRLDLVVKLPKVQEFVSDEKGAEEEDGPPSGQLPEEHALLLRTPSLAGVREDS